MASRSEHSVQLVAEVGGGGERGSLAGLNPYPVESDASSRWIVSELS